MVGVFLSEFQNVSWNNWYKSKGLGGRVDFVVDSFLLFLKKMCPSKVFL